MIYDILKDHAGFMWFATKNGLNRYDGYDFKKFTHDPFDSLSISGDEIYCLFEDSRRRLWIGSKANGLNLYDDEKKCFYQVGSSSHQYHSISESTIYTIEEGPEGALWIGTDLGAFRIVVGKHVKAVPVFEIQQMGIEGEENPLVGSIKATQNGELFAKVYDKGIFLFNPVSQQFESIFENKYLQAEGGEQIMEYPKGYFWTNLNQGILSQFVYRSDYDQFELKTFDQISNIKDIVFNDKTNELLISQVFKNSVSSIVADKGKLTESIDPKVVVELSEQVYPTKLFFDDNHTLWMGTNGYGIRKLSVNKPSFDHLAPKRSINFITKINGHTFFTSRFMNVIPKGSTIAQPAKELLGITNELRGIYQAESGHIWAFSHPIDDNPKVVRLFKMDANFALEKEYRIENINPQYGKVLEDAAGNLWFPGDLVDFVRFNPNTEIAEPFNCSSLSPLPAFNKSYYSFYKDQQGIFWKGSSSGLMRMELNAEGQVIDCDIFQNDPSNIKSLSNNTVSATIADPVNPERYIWIGTKGGGLNKFDKIEGTFEHFTVRDGLPDNVIYGILVDAEQKLWLSTNKGLAQFDPVTKNSRHFSAADGLQDDEFNTAAFYQSNQDERMYFGGINGLSTFIPSEIEIDRYQPPVYITSIKINGEEVPIQHSSEQESSSPLTKTIEKTKQIDLAWHQNQLSLEFAALDFSIPEKNLYQYRLSKVHKDWIDAGTDRRVNFGSLAPGKYIFEVKGSNSSGVWNETPTALTIFIHPPWWRTNLAYAIYILIIAGSILGLYRFQLNRTRLKSQLLYEQKEAERLAQLDRLKSNFFSNITHEFRTPLTLILEPVRQMLSKDLPKGDLEQLEEKLRLVRNNGDRLLLMVNQLLDLSKLEGQQMKLDIRLGNVVEVLRAIFEAFVPMADQKGINLHWKEQKDIPHCYFDKDKLEKVVGNLLSNALKFTHQGSCTLDISYQKHPALRLQIKISDSGIGIPPTELDRIFDRFYQVDSSSTRSNAGTGIGLSLTKELMQLMNGQISVESTVGKGTSFQLQLPMEKAALSAGMPIHSSGEAVEAQASQNRATAVAISRKGEPGTTSPPGAHLANQLTNQEKEEPPLLLLVEDNPELRSFLKQSLARNFKVEEAADGQEGIEKAIEHIPDLIISDLMMPRKNGYELTDTLKQNEKTSHIPIVLLTAKAAAESQVEGVQKGADVYLTKPFNTEVLLAYIHNLIEVRRKLHQKYQVQEKAPIGEKLKVFEPSEHQFLKKLHQILEEQLDNSELTADELARKMLMSRSQLHRKIKALTNQHTTEFIRSYRLDRAMELLRQQKGNVTEVAFQVGFASQKYFSRRFKEKFGQNPSEVS
ncbi:MAG: ATP-binding protein, partial [Saprospiraceae bacterium]|nr:ATP-binding protein [Saprospiraceae bacterium]